MEAISVPLSENWDGNDGPWSSFALQLGTAPHVQVVSVLPATSKSNIWPILPDLCPLIKAVGDCATFRGGLYHLNETSTFTKIKHSSPYFELPFLPEQPLDYNGTGVVGTETVTLGGVESGVATLQRQAISAFAYTTPFIATGLLGLSNQSLDVTDAADQYASPLSMLQKNQDIPSKFYGYTAGARWLHPRVYASLTLGGYDSARGGDLKHALKVQMAPFPPRDLVVSIKALSVGDGKEHVVEGVDAFIDSVVPELWLPAEICEYFEEEYHLQWNETAEMYLLSEDQYSQLVASDARVWMRLADPADAKNTVTISLAAAAFGLQAKYPLAGIQDDSIQPYFPLKRAYNLSQVYLGHAFLQEAYLAVDYDRSEFYLSQANLINESNIKTVKSGSQSGLSTGAIAGIAVGVVVLLLIVASVVTWFICRPRWKKRRNSRYRAKVEAQNYGLPDTQLPNSPEMEMHEYYAKRPLSPESDHKQELDATTTARGSTTSRAEMESPSQSSLGSPRGKGTPRRSSYGFPGSPAELESRSPRMMHSRTASGSSIEPMSPLSGVGRRGLEPHEEVHEMP